MPELFPNDFVWGAAAASYQVEGAAFEDGRGLSVWDMFVRRQGKVWEGHTGDVACDHYHRVREDVGLMKALGLKAYRLSIGWPRVLPEGVGAANEKGLAFYDRLIDELLAAGIQPWVTLFHWDFPLALYHRGGWLNRDSAQWFADYTALIADRLSDRVAHWMTLNEPQCFIALGHLTGEHAPGDKLGNREFLRAGHHALLAHGRAVQTLRARCRQKPVIGWAPAAYAPYPATNDPADIAVARAAFNRVESHWNNAWWADPVILGHYPESGLKLYGHDAPTVEPGDMETIRQPLDFFGTNLYSGQPMRAGPDGNALSVGFPPGHAHTLFLWKVAPLALYWCARFLAESYRLPIVVTENGTSGTDWVAVDGKVHDPARIDFMMRYLVALRHAIADGVDVRGYFHWSIMDNFEWAEGYKHRFGLIHVDYSTLKRTPKDSYHFYANVIRSNGGFFADVPFEACNKF